MEAPTPPPPSASPELRPAAAGRRGFVILTLSLVTLTCAATLTLWPREYAGRTRFRVHQGAVPAVAAVTAGDAPRPVPDDWLETHVNALTSSATLLPVVRSLGLAGRWKLTENTAVSRLAGMLEIEHGPEAGVLTLTAWSTSATEAADLANEVRSVWQEQRRAGETERVRLQAEARLQIIQEAAEKARAVMMKLMPGHDGPETGAGTGETVPDKSPLAEAVAEHRKILDARETQVKQLKQQLHSLDGKEGDSLISAAAVLAFDNETFKNIYPEWQTHLTIYTSLQNEGFGTLHPKMQGVAAAISTMRKQLIASVEVFKTSLTARLQQAEAAAAEAKKDLAVRSGEAARERAGQRNYTSAKYDYERRLDVLKSLEERSQKQSPDGKPPWQPATVLQTAAPAGSPSRPGLLLLLTLSAAAGLLLSILFAPCLDYFRTLSRQNP